jgi:hypothetical protein
MLNFSTFIFLEEIFFVKKNEVSFEMFENILIFEMKNFKINELLGRHVLKLAL